LSEKDSDSERDKVILREKKGTGRQDKVKDRPKIRDGGARQRRRGKSLGWAAEKKGKKMHWAAGQRGRN